jgi:arsenate reductase
MTIANRMTARYNARVALTVYQYPNCSTCKKALKWLDAKGVAYTSIDITKSPPSAAVLAKLGIPVKKLFNVSGVSYREGGWKDKQVTDAQAYAALAKDGKLIKRPLLIGDGFALAGFVEADWAAAVG